ncbi:ABC transporter substrate-binding protein [Haloarchaeobius sp. DYHT-AS-18]|uniref:ABC transporter substrate-binding protein n=1 Tax=Haloarchaeobius sp. DYHT-AS-18 TaxID=3446117 RepID=UPI003EB922B7
MQFGSPPLAMPDSENWRNAISRRKALQAAALGGASLIAGCSGGNNGSGSNNDEAPVDGTSSGDGTTVYDAEFVELDRQGTPPMKRHFNPWNPTNNGCWFPGQAVFNSLAKYVPASDENIPLIAKSWEMPEEKVLEVELSDEYTWHNGDQFVAADWATQYQIQKNLAELQSEGEGNASIYDSIEATDDTHLRIKINSNLSTRRAVMNTIAVHNGTHSYGVFTKHDAEPWATWRDTLMNGSESEKQSVAEEISTTAKPKIQNAIGNGPFQVDQVGDQEIILKRYEDYPNADQINFKNYTYWIPPNTGQVFQPFANNVVTATSKGFPVQNALKKQLPENTELFREGLSANKLFAFNMGHQVEDSIVSNRHVRRALLHVFDREGVKNLLTGVNSMYEWPSCRIPGKVMEDETHPSAKFVKENFEQYGDGDTERAAKILREQGFEKNSNGEWLTDSGERFEVEMLNAANRSDFGIWIQQLKDFGVKVTQENIDSATFDERRKKGDYDIIPDGSSANGVFAMWTEDLVVNWLLKTLLHGQDEYDIPMPIGDPSGSGGTKTISISEHIAQWMVTDDEQYHHELMWWWNQFVPEHENMYRPDAGAINTTNFNWKDVPDSVVNGSANALTLSFKIDGGSVAYQP